MSLKKPTLGTRIKNFFQINWWFTGVSNIIMIFLILMFMSRLTEVNEDFTVKLDNALKNVIIATPDGRVKVLGKELIDTDSDYFKNHIKKIVKTMNTSESLLTHGFDVKIASKIDDYSSLKNVSEEFKILGDEFFESEEKFNVFLRFYYNKLKMGELPNKIQVFKTDAKFFPLGDNKFRIEVTFSTQKDFVNKITNQPREIKAVDVIIIDGYINPSKYTSTLNPFGVRITDFRLGLFLYEDFMKR